MPTRVKTLRRGAGVDTGLARGAMDRHPDPHSARPERRVTPVRTSPAKTMKLATPLVIAAALAACAPGAPQDETVSMDAGAQEEEAAATAALPAGAVRHVVVFKYRDDATEAQIQQVTDAFRALQDKIPGILAFEHGQNHSPEGKDQGFDHVYTVTFESAAARDTYLPHPEHAAFGRILGEVGILEEAFVVDYDPLP